MNNDALTARLESWIENARQNVRNIQDVLCEPSPVNPATLAARMADHLAKIEAWEQVLSVLA